MYSEMRKKNAFKKRILKEKQKTKNLDTHEVSEKGKEKNEYCICNQEQLKMTSPVAL